jgi:hypothetical protein
MDGLSAYGHRSYREAHASNELARERSVVKWQVGRQDPDNAGWSFVANAGDDTACEVAILAWDGPDHRVTVRADKVPPYLTDAENGYVDFTLEHRITNGPGKTRPEQDAKPLIPPGALEHPQLGELFQGDQRHYEELIAAEEARQVCVRITWRSEGGR